MKRLAFVMLFFCVFLGQTAVAQTGTFELKNRSGSDKIQFQLINNLIIIPVEINDVELSFILDSGVSKPILFNASEGDEVLNESNVSSIFLKGLGDGQMVEAIKSKRNKIKIGDAISFNHTIFAAFNTGLDYSPKLGIPIHGIIGYDLFKDFVVEINYHSKYLKLIKHENYKERICKKCEQVGLTLRNGKPHIKASVAIADQRIPIHVLLDTGASDALWLFEDESQDIVSTQKYIDDFLGYGLSGSLYGKRSRVEALSIQQFKLSNSLVAFPEGSSIEILKQNNDRNGTIGAEILRRFNLIFNYKDQTLILKKNSNFKSEFTYNKSGIDLEQRGIRVVKDYYYNLNNGRLTFAKDVTEFVSVSNTDQDYRFDVRPAFQIAKLRDNSPAKNAGMLLGDIILKVNNKDIKDYSLQEVIEMLNGKSGKRMKVLVDRNGRLYEYQFKLIDLI
ncbi:PDZ domain-containing protein [Hanstruepera marina]|uniref:PDZ domain-containing protein n=1 Tax=Hanstruepera marina TaxID=2873265 RepID=UPI001CA610B3|nr:PDZ domain-containing protein [Hanstruepera marina]